MNVSSREGLDEIRDEEEVWRRDILSSIGQIALFRIYDLIQSVGEAMKP